MVARVVGLAVLAFLLAPLVVVVPASVSPTAFLTFPPEAIVLDWYRAALASETYVGTFLTSVGLALLAATVSVVLGTSAALALARFEFPGKGALENALMSPLMLPPLILGIALLVLFAQVGVVGSYAALLVGHAILTFPFALRSVTVTLHGLDWSVHEAARTLGAGPLAAFFLVTLPVIRPGVAAGAIFAFIVSFDNVPVSIFLSGTSYRTLPVEIYQQLGYGVDPTVAAVSVILITINGVALALLERTVRLTRYVGA